MIRKPLLALAAALCVALPAAAAEPQKRAEGARALDLPGAVELINRSYPGRVIAAQADASGGEALHYHVDLLLPSNRIARFDVDGTTGRIFNRLAPEPVPAAGPSLRDAVKKVEASTQGRAVAAEFDPDPAPHFHVNVRMPGGKLERFDIATATDVVSPHVPR